MQDTLYSEADYQGLARSLIVARTGVRAPLTDGASKLLGFFLMDGECDALIGAPVIEVRYSWLQRRKPSTYFASLAPELISHLMDLGGVPTIDKSAQFTVGPTTTGTERYRFGFLKKWVLIDCSYESILIRIRDQQPNLSIPLQSIYQTTTII